MSDAQPRLGSLKLRDIGEACYHAFAQKCGERGTPQRAWSSLSSNERRAWVCAAREVLNMLDEEAERRTSPATVQE